MAYLPSDLCGCISEYLTEPCAAGLYEPSISSRIFGDLELPKEGTMRYLAMMVRGCPGYKDDGMAEVPGNIDRIETIIRHFPREKISILLYDEMKASPCVIPYVLDFLLRNGYSGLLSRMQPLLTAYLQALKGLKKAPFRIEWDDSMEQYVPFLVRKYPSILCWGSIIRGCKNKRILDRIVQCGLSWDICERHEWTVTRYLGYVSDRVNPSSPIGSSIFETISCHDFFGNRKGMEPWKCLWLEAGACPWVFSGKKNIPRRMKRKTGKREHVRGIQQEMREMEEMRDDMSEGQSH